MCVQLAEGAQEELSQRGEEEKRQLQGRLEEMEDKEQVLQARIEALQADNDFTNERLSALQGREIYICLYICIYIYMSIHYTIETPNPNERIDMVHNIHTHTNTISTTTHTENGSRIIPTQTSN